MQTPTTLSRIDLLQVGRTLKAYRLCADGDPTGFRTLAGLLREGHLTARVELPVIGELALSSAFWRTLPSEALSVLWRRPRRPFTLSGGDLIEAAVQKVKERELGPEVIADALRPAARHEPYLLTKEVAEYLDERDAFDNAVVGLEVRGRGKPESPAWAQVWPVLVKHLMTNYSDNAGKRPKPEYFVEEVRNELPAGLSPKTIKDRLQRLVAGSWPPAV